MFFRPDVFLFFHSVSSFSVKTYNSLRKDVNDTVGYLLVPEYKNLLKMKPDLRPSGVDISATGDDIIAPMQTTLVLSMSFYPKFLSILSSFQLDIL